MADIRINSLPTTASASSSDDFLALDGATNGTRKLNAFSPTFGGNLTVSGVTTSAGISNSGALTFTAAIGQVAGSIAKNATYGLTYYGVTGSSNDNTMLNASGVVVLSNPAGTTNATLSGNLTVSGTGTSSFGGKIQSSVATATGYNQLYDTTGITTGRGAFAITSTGAGLALGIEASVGGTSFANSTAYASYFGSTTATPVHFVANASIGATLTSGGNLLIGTTTDSGNGKLQLATHTTSAGGIGFGTDTSLYRSAAGQLRGPSSFIDATFASSGLFFGASMTLQANDNVLIKTNGSVTALTLDTSQNATFAGTILTATNAAKNAIVARYNSSNSLFGVTVNSAGQGVISENNDASTGSDKYSKTGLPAFRLGNTGGSGTVPFWIDVAASGTAGNAITWTNAFQIDSSQNATFAGQITASGISHKLGSGGTGSANAVLTIDGSSASSYGSYIVLQRNSTNKWQFGTYSGINGGTSDDFLLYNPTAANEALKIAAATSNATFAGAVIAGTWASGTADKLKVTTAVSDYAAYFANTVSSGGSYGIRLHTNTTAATDYLLVATSGAGGGSTRFIIKSDGTLNAPSLPTSSAGLSAGDIWNDGGTLKIV